METIAFIIVIFLAVSIVTGVSAVVFIILDMILDHRLSSKIGKWFDRKFGV